MPHVYVSLPAVLIAALANFLLGALWYSPVLFAKTWAELVKLTSEDRNKSMLAGMLAALAAALITAYVLGYFLGLMQIRTFTGGFLGGLCLSGGFVATTTGMNAVFEQRPWRLYLINISCTLLGTALMGGILASWR